MFTRARRVILVWIVAATPTLGAQEVMPTAVLRGSVVTPDGHPVAGVTLEFRRRATHAFNCLDLKYARTTRLVRRTRTARDGSFAVHLPLGLACELHLDVPPFARIMRSGVWGGGELPLRLQLPASIKGRIACQDTGAACAGALVKACDRADYANRSTGSSDARGRFVLTRLAPGNYFVAVQPRLTTTTMWQKVTLRAGGVAELVVPTRTGEVLGGTVVDAATGAPIPGAQVGPGWTLARSVRTDATGRFTMPGFGGADALEVHVRAPGYEPYFMRRQSKFPLPRGEVPPPVLPDDVSDLRVELPRGYALAGRIVTPDGKPAAGVYVAAAAWGIDWTSARTDARGRFSITGRRSDVESTLFVHGDGWATTLYTLPPHPAGVALQDLGATPFVLQPRHTVVVQVRGAGGVPCAGQRAELWGYNADRCRLHQGAHLVNPLGGVEHNVAKRRVMTDPRGYCQFGDLPVGRYRLEVGGETTAIEVKAGQVVQELEVRR